MDDEPMPYIMVILIVVLILCILVVGLAVAFFVGITFLEGPDGENSRATQTSAVQVVDHPLPDENNVSLEVIASTSGYVACAEPPTTSNLENWAWSRTSTPSAQTSGSNDLLDRVVWPMKKKDEDISLSIISISSSEEKGDKSSSATGSVYSFTSKLNLSPRVLMEGSSTPSLAGSIENVARYSRMEANYTSHIPENPQLPLRMRQIAVPYVPLVSDMQREALISNWSSVPTSGAESQTTLAQFSSSASNMNRNWSPQRVSSRDKCLPPVEEPSKTDAESPSGAGKPVGIKMVDTTRVKGRDLTIDELLQVEELRNKNRQIARHKRRAERKKSSPSKSTPSSHESVPVQVSEEEPVSYKASSLVSPTSRSAPSFPNQEQDKPSIGIRRQTYPVITSQDQEVPKWSIWGTS